MNSTTTCTNIYLGDLDGEALNLIAFDVTNPNHPFVVYSPSTATSYNSSASPVLSTECVTVSASGSSTSEALYMNGFSYGDSIIILFLLMGITVYIFDVIIRNVAGVKNAQPLSRIVQGNNSKDGKEIESI